MSRERPVPVAMALVGAGRWGQCWLRTLLADPRVELRWICDSRQPRDGLPAGVRWSPSLTTVLEDRQVRALIIATPPDTHAELAALGLRSGRAVMVEKPLATNESDALGLCALADNYGQVLSVNHVLVYHSAVSHMLDVVSEGGLGTIRAIRATRRSTLRTSDARSLAAAALGGERCPLWTLGPHDLSLALRIQPRLFDGSWRASPIRLGQEIQIRGTGGDVAFQFRFSTSALGKTQRFAVIGDSGALLFDDLAPHKLRHYESCGRGRGDELIEWRSGQAVQYQAGVAPLTSALDGFVRSLAGGPNLTPGTEGLSVVRHLATIASRVVLPEVMAYQGAPGR